MSKPETAGKDAGAEYAEYGAKPSTPTVIYG